MGEIRLALSLLYRETGRRQFERLCPRSLGIHSRIDRYKLPIAHGREEEHELDSLFFPIEWIRYRTHRNGFLRYQSEACRDGVLAKFPWNQRNHRFFLNCGL